MVFAREQGRLRRNVGAKGRAKETYLRVLDERLVELGLEEALAKEEETHNRHHGRSDVGMRFQARDHVGEDAAASACSAIGV